MFTLCFQILAKCQRSAEKEFCYFRNIFHIFCLEKASKCYAFNLSTQTLKEGIKKIERHAENGTLNLEQISVLIITDLINAT